MGSSTNTEAASRNATVVRRFYEEAWNGRDLDLVDLTHAPGWVHHDPSNPTDLGGGPEGNKRRMQEVLTGFPDLRFTIEHLVADADQVAVHFRMQGTHLGTFAGVPATGAAANIDAMAIHRMADGQIAEDWVVRDTFTLLRQLGVVPGPPA